MTDAETILVTGGGGQLATELQNSLWPEGTEVHVLDIDQLDITSSESVAQGFEKIKPTVCINAAAFTAVDKAEEERELARAVNVLGVQNIVGACATFETKLVHVSTDYVFDGIRLADDDSQWRDELSPTNPVNYYGQTKLESEEVALKLSQSLVLRTSWVYSAHGYNFVKTMIRLAGEGKDIGVVADQLGCPTAASDLAKAIVKILESGMQHPGLYHCASPTDASWWDLADAAISGYGFENRVRKITTEEYPLPAKRPLDTRMSCNSLLEVYGVHLRPWRQALEEVVSELKASGTQL